MSKTETKALKLISVFLGFISVINMALLGIYIINHCLALAFLSRFLIEANIAGLATAISVTLILFGSYSIYTDRYLRGGLCNIIAGMITTGLYLYYTISFPILQKFGLLGYFLLFPAVISGVIGIIISKDNFSK